MASQLTLYEYWSSPYSERIELALKEGNISHKSFSVNLRNKPAFFTKQINPLGKVPAIAYGGPNVAPDEPSPLSFKLAESNVILEFLADTYPEAKLMPADPLQRARVRFFIETVTRKYIPAMMAWILDNEPQAAENHLKVIEFIQGLLPDDGEYAVRDGYTIADACFTPIIQRLQISIEYDIGKFPVGNGPKLGETLKDPKYAKFVVYMKAITSRPATKEVWNPKKDRVKEVWANMLGRESTYRLTPEQIQART